IKAVRANFERELTKLRGRIDELKQAGKEAEYGMLNQMQVIWIKAYLAKHRVENAKMNITFVHNDPRAILDAAGYHTAADIDSDIYRVPCIDHGRGNAIIEWREAL